MKKFYKTIVYILGGVLGIWLTASYLLPIGLPFLIGWYLSKLTQKPIDRLSERTRLPHGLLAFVTMTLVTIGLLLFFWFFGKLLLEKLEVVAQKLPNLLASLRTPLENLRRTLLHLTKKLGLGTALSMRIERLFDDGSGVADSAVQWLLSLATKIVSWIPQFVLFLLTTLLSAYFFAAEAPKIREFFSNHLPQNLQEKCRSVLKRLRSALRMYLKVQLRLSLLTFGITAVGLLLLGQEKAIWIAAIVALIDALPVFGAGTVLIPWAIVLFFSAKSVFAFCLLAIYAAAALARAILEPRLLGKQMGLSPILTLLALYGGFQLFGVLGMILLPVAALALKQLYELIQAGD